MTTADALNYKSDTFGALPPESIRSSHTIQGLFAGHSPRTCLSMLIV